MHGCPISELASMHMWALRSTEIHMTEYIAQREAKGGFGIQKLPPQNVQDSFIMQP
jgi:hypothetical protein